MDTGAWRDNDKLLVTLERGVGPALPDRCVRCNAPAEGESIKRYLVYVPDWVYLLVILNVLIAALVAAVVQKRIRLTVGFCPRHRRQRWLGLAVGWLIGVGCLALVWYGLIIETPAIAIVAGVASLGSMGFGIWASWNVRAGRVIDRYAWVKGVHADYLASMPEWTHTHRPGEAPPPLPETRGFD